MQNSPLSSYFVFIARFDDGRKKDRIAFQQADSRTEAEAKLAEGWYSHDDPGVSVDTLGPFPEFFSVAPKLNYDIINDPDLPNDLVERLGRRNLKRIIEVASSSDGWESLPPHRVLTHGTDYDTPTADEITAPATRLSRFRDRVQRIVSRDFVDYTALDKRTAAQYGLHDADRPVARLLRHLTRQRCLADDTVTVLVGMILSPEGVPRPRTETWTVPADDTEMYPSITDHPEYDLVIPAHPSDSARRIQHRALDAVTREYIAAEHENREHDWFLVALHDAALEYDWALIYARTPGHAELRAACELDIDLSTVGDPITTLFSEFKARVANGEAWPNASTTLVIDSGYTEPPENYGEVVTSAVDTAQ